MKHVGSRALQVGTLIALDTNVVVAAFATRGLSSDLVNLVLAEHQLILRGHRSLRSGPDPTHQDPADVPVVAEAMGGLADIHVSGDKDPLEAVDPPPPDRESQNPLGDSARRIRAGRLRAIQHPLGSH